MKAAVKRLLDEFKTVYVYMPVPGGFGKPTLDYLCSYRGRFFAIETKAPGKKPTVRQTQTITEIEKAMGKVFVIDDEQGPEIAKLRTWLTSLEASIEYDPDFTPDKVRRRTI